MRAIAVLCALSGTAMAQEAADVAYRVRQGDTLELIAAEFYGDHAHTAAFIVEENKPFCGWGAHLVRTSGANQ